MARHRTYNDKKTDEKSRIKTDVFTITVAILLYVSFGILLTIGGLLWVRAELKDFFDISYAGYGMLLIVLFAVSELWALFIQIPSIPGYNEIVASWFNMVRLFGGAIILLVLILLTTTYVANPYHGDFRLFLAKSVYRLSGNLQKNYVEQLKMIDEMIELEGVNAELFFQRGKIYLEIAEIKTDGTEEDKYSLPNNTSEECYNIAINNFSDAITQDEDNDVAEYYYWRGRAEYESKSSDYDATKDDFQKAIELDDTISDYDFYCARAWYEISTKNTDSDEAVQNAQKYIDSAIRKYSKKESDSDEGSESDAEADTDDEPAGELEHVNQDKILAEYYYYAGLINMSVESDRNLEKAIENYRKATKYDSENAEYFSRLGRAYYTSNDLTMAEEAFDRAILLDKAKSKHSDAGYNLSWKAYVIEEENMDEAIKVYEESINFDKDYPYSYRRLAELYKAKNDDAAVKNVYDRAIKNCADNTEFYYACGAMYYMEDTEDGYDHTIKDMKKAMEKDSSYTAGACNYTGRSYYELERYSEAYEYFQKAKDNGSTMDGIDSYMDDCLMYIYGE